ncbi:hypothetical protein EVC24_155 [Rhizobium phage RHph_I4]|nr:hypothetical protein EVC24_155 [Rhizobium phage RHph_I4]
MPKFRPQRGSLTDAMAEMRVFDTLDDLYRYVKDQLRPFTNAPVDLEAIKIEYYGYDSRIEWDQYIVTLKDYGVLGFLDGPFPGPETQPKRLHWYCFSFSWSADNKHGNACTFSGFERKDGFTRAHIEDNKRYAAPEVKPENMVLLGITYLGYMTKEEFRGESS